MKYSILILLSSGLLAGAEAPNRQILRVRIYDLDGMSTHALRRATDEAARILSAAGVDVAWEFGDPEAAEVHSIDLTAKGSARKQPMRGYLVVRVGRSLSGYYPIYALGMSLPNAQTGVSATIFEDRIAALCESARLDLGMVLGHVISHEIGHVLLGSSDHTPAGIMRARWGAEDFAEAAKGQLGFTVLQGAAIKRSPMVMAAVPEQQVIAALAEVVLADRAKYLDAHPWQEGRPRSPPRNPVALP